MNNSQITVVYDNTFDIIKSAVNKMVDFIKPTYGPAGNKVIISKFPYKMVVDDGVQAARDFKLTDPLEDSIVDIVREGPIRTSDRVKDSTTGSLIMTQAIINATATRHTWSGRQVKLELEKGLVEAKDQLRGMARQIKTKDEMKKIAMVSYDNESVAEMVSNLYSKLGKDAKITVDNSPTMDITTDMADGATIGNGYISPYMVTNPERMEAVIEKPYILLTDYRLTEASDVLPLLDKFAKASKHGLIIIAENVEQNALATLVINHPNVMNPHTRKPGAVVSLAINAPAGDDRKVFMEDLALLTGAKFFSESKGDKIENAEFTDLGRADRIISSREETIIVSPKGKQSDIKKAIADLRTAITLEKVEKARKALEDRLARFTNSIAVIKVGAATENERKAIKYKVENAVNAVKNALKAGVIAGGGCALERIKTSSNILNEALKKPKAELWANMEMDFKCPDLKAGEAFNVITQEHGDMLKVGVADPVESIIAGLESAVSIAGVLLTSHRMIVEHATKEKKAE